MPSLPPPEPTFFIILHLLQVIVLLVVLRFADVNEREPFAIIAAMFAWGALGATVLSLVGNEAASTVLARLVSPRFDAVFGAAIAAPVVEELSKGLALVAAFVLSHLTARHFGTNEFSGPTDGMVYGAAIGLGFSFTENIFYYFVSLFGSGDPVLGIDVFLLRVNFGGLSVAGHALFTAVFGAGLGLATWTTQRWRRVAYPLAGLLAGMALHALWNLLPVLLPVVRLGYDLVADAVLGARLSQAEAAVLTAASQAGELASQVLFYVELVAAAAAFSAWLRHERRIISRELAGEILPGLLDAEEARLLICARARARCYWRLLKAGRSAEFSATVGLHEALVDFALLKWRVRCTGERAEAVGRMRAEVMARRAYADHIAALSASGEQGLGFEGDDAGGPERPKVAET